MAVSLGGYQPSPLHCTDALPHWPGSIPELEETTDSIYNTCTVYSPAGELVAVHRKVHLFDIDIPGGITFKESDSLTGGKSLNSFETRAYKALRSTVLQGEEN